MEYLEVIFSQYQVFGKNYIRVTRNGDISPDDEAYVDCEDFRYLMRKTLDKRRRMSVVRLEVAYPLEKEMEKYFCERFAITPECIFRTKMPMKLGFMFSIAEKVPVSMKRLLVDLPFTPQPCAFLEEGSVMNQVKKSDVLLSYPYESMDPFLQMIREASVDPNVVTIKITIYRLAQKTRLVEYLCAAAENGKEVTVLIELRARFDEQNNIDWSERLEEAGCRVLYGLEGYKVHSKICLITYRYRNEVRYLTQIGTGNYNEKTATMYTDYSLMTGNQAIGEDAALFFKNMSMGNLAGEYRHLLVAPASLKTKILKLMDEEIKKGSKGRILMKMNAVTDLDFIRKVAQASKAGVKVELIVRGICCLLPGIEKETENVTVTSIVGRYLEHPRVYVFGQGAEAKVFLGSADMMTRNTQKRVEVICPIYDEAIKKRLIRNLHVMLADNVKARVMLPDGTYRKKPQGDRKLDSQEYFMREAMYKKHAKKPKKKWKFWRKKR
jgi:polyphosphate kinase